MTAQQPDRRRVSGQAAGDLPTKELPSCSGDERGDDVGGMPVQAGTRPVIPHRGARVGMRGRFLDIAQRDAGVKRRCNERVLKSTCYA
jgi:hypothetical protein